MTFDSLPAFLQHLEKNQSLKRISAEVDPDLEITEIVNRLYAQSISSGKGVPAFFFEHVKGSKFPLVVNLLGMESSIESVLGGKAEAIGETFHQSFTDFQTVMQKKKLWSWLWRQRKFLCRLRSAKTVSVSDAPLKQVKRFGSEINLNEFPITKSWPLDGGKFITAGLVMTKSPKSGARNLGIYRLQVLNRNTLALHWQIQKGGAFHYSEAESLNQPLEVAVAIGTDPSLWLAGILPLPEGIDEMAFAGFIRGKAVPMIHCETLDLEVPASAEFVIEGIARPGKRALEGPFGDHFGHYSHPAEFPVLEIQCVTHRKNAVWHSAVVGKPLQEDRAMGETVTKIFAPVMKMMKPELMDLWAYYEAGFHNLLAVSVKQRYGKEAIKTAFGILSEGQLSLSKCVILVDPGVNLRSFSEVLKAVRKNFDPKEDFILLPGTAQDTLDFTGPKINRGSKMILDATEKVRSRNSEEVSALDRLDLNSFSKTLKADSRMMDFRIIEETLLAVQVKSGGKEILQKLLQIKELRNLKIIAVVSEDVPLSNDVLLIWGIFTRFDCERDVFFASAELMGSRPVYSGPMGIDATWKENYPKPVEMAAEIVDRVSRRWKDYGLE